MTLFLEQLLACFSKYSGNNRDMKTATLAVEKVYEQACLLSSEERETLFAMILEDIAPQPPNSIRSLEHLKELLLEGMQGEPQPVTEQTWESRRLRIAELAAMKRK